MIHTVDLIKEIVDSFDPKTVIKQVSTGVDTVLKVCNLMYIREQSKVKINNIEYTVKSVDEENKEITIAGIIPVNPGDYIQGGTVHYFHGTPIATANQLVQIQQVQNKTPLLYLLEVISDRFDEDPESSIDRESDMNLFFLDEANFKDWDTDQHYSGAIKPMSNLATMFKEHLKTSIGIGVIDESTMSYHAKFGLSIRNESGHLKNLFPETFSGVQLRIKIPFLKSLICDC